jgi:hypothetical protein
MGGMERKIALGISLGVLFIAFGIISLLVILTKRHPYFVAKKLRLGALIISLSGFAAGCSGGAPKPVVSCYTSADELVFSIDQADSLTGSIVLHKGISDTITGKIRTTFGNEIYRDSFAYAIIDSANSIVFKNDILSNDGAFDGKEEEFKIGLGNAVMPGTYEIRLYDVPRDSIKIEGWYVKYFPLTIME